MYQDRLLCGRRAAEPSFVIRPPPFWPTVHHLHAIAAISTALTAACGFEGVSELLSQQPRVRTASAEACAVVQATLDSLFLLPQRGQLAIREYTFSGPRAQRFVTSLSSAKKLLPGIDSSTQADYVARNARLEASCAAFPSRRNIVVVPDDAIRNDASHVVGTGDYTENFNWEQFGRRYRKAHGLLIMSAVGFSRARDQAVVFLGLSASGGNDAGYIALSQRDSRGKWHVRSAWMVYIE